MSEEEVSEEEAPEEEEPEEEEPEEEEPEEEVSEEEVSEEEVSEEETASVEEAVTEEPFFRYMGDVDNNKKVTAADARIILRVSVSLEEYHPDRLAYADIDFDGKISAADARLALRISVGLEKTVSHDFSYCSESFPTCLKNGRINGECLNCKKTIDLTLPLDTHIPESWDCSGVTKCIVCRTEYFVGEDHSYHGYKCIYCFDMKKEDFYNDLKKYIIENGVSEDGVYYYDEVIEYENFSLCYDTSTDTMYAFCGIAVETEDGQIVYYFNYIDFNSDFSDYTIELDCYVGDIFAAYAVYGIDTTKLSADVPGSLTLTEFDSVPELSNIKNEFSLISEGLVYDTVMWIEQVAQRFADCDATELMGFDKI